MVVIFPISRKTHSPQDRYTRHHPNGEHGWEPCCRFATSYVADWQRRAIRVLSFHDGNPRRESSPCGMVPLVTMVRILR